MAEKPTRPFFLAQGEGKRISFLGGLMTVKQGDPCRNIFILRSFANHGRVPDVKPPQDRRSR